MLFNFLNNDEKKNFLELAYYVANCNDELHANEEVLLQKYRKEMELEDYQLKNRELDFLLEFFTRSSFVSKAALFLEIMSIIVSDFEYDAAEQEVVKQIKLKWQISDDQFEAIIQWLANKDIVTNQGN